MTLPVSVRHLIMPASMVVVLFSLSVTVRSADWPTFRGPDRSAVSNERGLLQEWPEGGPKLAWEAKGVGRGYSSAVVADGRVYTLGDGLAGVPDQDEYLICLDRQNGREHWKSKTGPAWNQGKPNWQSSRGTPTVDSDRVYVVTASGELICCNTADGHERWRKNLKTDFGGLKADNWGYSESVLIDGERLICTPGGEKATLVALAKRTGETVWTAVSPGDRGAGHASIVIAEVGGTRVYVQSTGGGALGVRAADGTLLWSYPIDKTTAVIPTPIVRGDLVFFDAGYKRGGALLRQVAKPDGTVAIEELYPLKPNLGNKHGGIVLVGDYLYGDSEDTGVPFCAELATGEIRWQKRGSGKGSAAMAAADGRLYILYSDGTAVLAKADPEGYTEVGWFKTPGEGERPSWAHPVIADGKLYLRVHDRVLCYDVRARAAARAN